MKDKININRIMIAFFKMYKMLGSVLVLALNIVILFGLLSYWDLSIRAKLIVGLIVIGFWALIELTDAICDYFIEKFNSRERSMNNEDKTK